MTAVMSEWVSCSLQAKATLERCGMRQYVLTENGARAVRIADSTPVWETWLDGGDVSATLSRIKAALPSARFAQLTSEGGLVEDSHPWLQADATRAAAEKIFPKAVPDVVAELKTGYRCAKTYVHIPGSDDFSTTMGLVKEAAGTGWEVREIKQLLPSMSRTCEVQSSTVNKADGLRELCKAIDVPMQHVWAFGDDANDVRMLSEVGWGVCMANHLPALAGVGRDLHGLRLRWGRQISPCALTLRRRLASAVRTPDVGEAAECRFPAARLFAEISSTWKRALKAV
eukprot:s12_g20.t2